MDNNPKEKSVDSTFNQALALSMTGKGLDIDVRKKYILPPGYTVTNLGAELCAPKRRKGFIDVHDMESLIKMTTAYATDPETVLIIQDKEYSKFLSVFNFHEANGDGNGWGDHGCILRLEQSIPFQEFMNLSGKLVSQRKMVEFLEDHLPHIAAPTGAEVLEFISNIRIKRSAEWVSCIDTATGATSLQYVETQGGDAVKGQVAAISELTLGLQPYTSSSIYQIKARLVYEIGSDNNLVMRLKLVGVENILEAAFFDEIQILEQEFTDSDITIINGSSVNY